MKLVKLWLEPLDEGMFFERSREKILVALKGQEAEKKLIALLPTDKLKNTFHEKIESHIKGTLKEKILSRNEIEHKDVPMARQDASNLRRARVYRQSQDFRVSESFEIAKGKVC